MSFIGLRVPPETARLLWSFWESDYENLGETVPRDHAHITILNLGKDLPIEGIAKAVEATFRVASTTRPFTVSTNRVSVFPPGDSGVPIICPIDSPELHDFHRRLCESFDAAGIQYSKKFPEYKPHVTLAFAQDPLLHADWGSDIDFSTIEWGAHEAVLWGGDHGDNKLFANFPFALNPYRTAVRRSIIKEAMRDRADCSPRRSQTSH
jgi:2'-5' RNA ligase